MQATPIRSKCWDDGNGVYWTRDGAAPIRVTKTRPHTLHLVGDTVVVMYTLEGAVDVWCAPGHPTYVEVYAAGGGDSLPVTGWEPAVPPRFWQLSTFAQVTVLLPEILYTYRRPGFDTGIRAMPGASAAEYRSVRTEDVQSLAELRALAANISITRLKLAEKTLSSQEQRREERVMRALNILLAPSPTASGSVAARRLPTTSAGSLPTTSAGSLSTTSAGSLLSTTSGSVAGSPVPTPYPSPYGVVRVFVPV